MECGHTLVGIYPLKLLEKTHSLISLSRLLDRLGILHFCMVNRKYPSRIRIEPATGYRRSSKYSNAK